MLLLADRIDRLDRFLARLLPEHSRSKLVKLIDEGQVSVDGKPQKPSFALQPGMSVEFAEPGPTSIHDLSPAQIPLDIVFEDDWLVVVNKPRGLASHPAISLKEPSLVNALLGRQTELSTIGGEYRPGIVHRLDKETTGLMVVAKTDRAHALLAAQMESKSAERRYVAVVAGNVERERFTIDAPMARSPHNRILMAVDPNGKSAVTHLKRVGRADAGFVLACRLETGRTHQIRVHLRAVGHPILGDRLYAPKEFASGDLQLHAGYLAFDHPGTQARVAFYAPAPESFLGAHLVTEETLADF